MAFDLASLTRRPIAATDAAALAGLVGYSSAAHKPVAEGVHRVVVSGGVHPDHRRRGLGAELLHSTRCFSPRPVPVT
ncbi:GNAT family N-acetyltransferase [Streptomyces sp. NPDC059701]|uniref:GNAT family N-acetyltransferase n=1 Tax=Streptomyces sp. NPDC059701 TaxID=3346914 RepID=UPI0036BEC970